MSITKTKFELLTRNEGTARGQVSATTSIHEFNLHRMRDDAAFVTFA